MEPKSILALLGLFDIKMDVNPVITEETNGYTVYAKTRDESPRVCPRCKSNSVIINDKKLVKILFPNLITENKSVTLYLTKKKFKCKNCGKKFVQQVNVVRKKCSISNHLCWSAYSYFKRLMSFSEISRILGISTSQIINIFDQMVKVGRRALSTVLCIDEKHFKTEHGKYIAVLSNGMSGRVLDIIPSRVSAYLDAYFYKLSKNEIETVKYFVSDMFEGYRKVKIKFFPNAIHIIDFFHIKKLFTEAIQIIRKRCMKSYDIHSSEYKFIKKNWKMFICDPEKINEKHFLLKTFIDENGCIIDKQE